MTFDEWWEEEGRKQPRPLNIFLTEEQIDKEIAKSAWYASRKELEGKIINYMGGRNPFESEEWRDYENDI